MRKIILAVSALAIAGFAMQAAPASAQDRTVIIKQDGDRHDGWRRHHRTKKVVIINRRHRHESSGVRVRVN